MSNFNIETALNAVDLTDALANSSLNIEPATLSKALETVNTWIVAEKNVDVAKNATAVAFLDMGFKPDDMRAKTADPKTWALGKMIIKRGLPQPVLDLIAAGEKSANRVALEEAAEMSWASSKGKVNSLCGKLAGQMQLEQDKREGKVCRVTGALLDDKDATHRKHLHRQVIDKFDDAIKKIEDCIAKGEADPDFKKTCGKADLEAASRLLTAARIAAKAGTLPSWYPKNS